MLCAMGTAAFAQAPQPLPPLPLTQLAERGTSAEIDNRTFTLIFAQPVPLQDLLLLLVRGTNLSIVPDPQIAGSFLGELKNVTVRQALDSILPPFNLDYRVDGGLIRVVRREPETRIFDVNYVATGRSGTSTVGAAANASSSGSATVSSVTDADLFADLTRGVQTLLSAGALFNVDRKAGLVQVTDYPERLARVADYLEAVHDRAHRQVQLDARVLEVEMNEGAAGIDWDGVASRLSPPPSGASAALSRRPAAGLRVSDLSRLMTELAGQGKVTTLGTSRLVSLNNEPSLVRSDAVTLSVTPQIASDGMVMLGLSPIVKAPSMAESDTLARVADGETLVISGFTHAREVRERRNVGIRGGWFGRRTVVTRRTVEVVILLTPRILMP